MSQEFHIAKLTYLSITSDAEDDFTHAEYKKLKNAVDWMNHEQMQFLKKSVATTERQCVESLFLYAVNGIANKCSIEKNLVEYICMQYNLIKTDGMFDEPYWPRIAVIDQINDMK